MKPSGTIALLAALLAIVTAVAAFFLLQTLMHEDFAGSIYERGIPLAVAGFVLLPAPYLYQALDGRRRRFSLTLLPDQTTPLSGYLLPAPLLFLFGLFFLFAAGGVAVLLIWLIGEMAVIFVTSLIRLLNFLVVTLAAFAVGSWIGGRAEQRPYLTSLAVVLAYGLLALLVNRLIGASFSLLLFSGAVMVYLPAALLGTWHGRRRQFSRYIHFLLSQVPPEQRPAAGAAIYQQVLNALPPEPARRPGGLLLTFRRIFAGSG
jgi:hypothetical protein